MVVLRTLLARVRLEEDRAARAETRAGLMALVEPSSAVPVSACCALTILLPLLVLVFCFLGGGGGGSG